MAKWLPLKEDFDKTLPIKKWRCDVNVKLSANNYDGALSELPNIDIKTCWNNPQPENGYAFSNRFNAGSNAEYFSSRYYNFTDGKWTATTTSHTTKVEGTDNTYEFECPVDLYWAGNRTDPWDPLLETKFQLYVEASSLEVDVEDITATSGSSSFTINVSADTGVSWTASSEDTWINLSPTTGMGNGAITVNIPANPTYEERSGEIALLSSDEGDITIPVYQAKKAAILTRHQMYRNGEVINKAYRGGELVYLNINNTQPVPPEPVYSAMPLTFEIISAGTITWERYGGASTGSKTIQYKKNDGEWTSITSNTGDTKPYVNVVPGDIVVFKGNNNSYYSAPTNNMFGGSATFKAYGNILSLIYGDNYQTETELPSGDTLNTNQNFDSLFWKNSGITDASNIIMPQNTKNTCYHRMFEDCYNLEKAPVLPALTLEPYAYEYMFANCPKLVYVKCLATNISANNCTSNWLNGVSPTGTFVKHPNMNSWTRGTSGIPTNWSVENA